LKYTGFWKRVGAQLVDGLIINSCVGIGTFLVDQVFMLNLRTGDVFNLISPLFIIFKVWYGLGYWCILLFYEVIFNGSVLQATPGKLLLNMKIVDKEGNRIAYLRSLMRFISKFISGILAIGFLMVAFTKYKQGLHDKIAGTLVVESENKYFNKNVNALIIICTFPYYLLAGIDF
jgi:uncharacterized RDD family membrane protein YckC